MTYTDLGAEISNDQLYRYTLWRTWEQGKPGMVFIMLNPSTADATYDDPTIRRCVGFAERNGCGGIRVVNLFAFRSTEPTALFSAVNPVGPGNDSFIEEVIAEYGPMVCAWGVNVRKPWMRARAEKVVDILREHRNLHVLDLTEDGIPKHPLMLKNELKPKLWKEAKWISPFEARSLEVDRALLAR